MPHDLHPVTQLVTKVLAGVEEDLLDRPTPCGDDSVRVVVFHLIGLSTAFRDAARKDLGETTATPPEDIPPDLPPDWRERAPRALAELADAWADPAAWEGMTQAGGVTLPGDVAGAIALNEVLVHGWDVAVATGQPYEPDEATLRSSYDLLWPDRHDQQARAGMFGPVVEVPPDRPLLEQVIGLAGRDPGWKPAS